jgi:hypothetical protein
VLSLLAALAALTLAAGPATAATDGGAPVDRVITDPRITESSGLAASLLHPGVLWTHNDSGNPPRIYAIGPSGGTRATLTLEDEPDVDWEAIASLRMPAGTGAPSGPLIAVGDIGDNNAVRSSVRIMIVPEPARLRSASVLPVRVLRLRYPDHAHDAETLLADPRTGRFYVVDKTLFGATLYAVPPALWPGRAGSHPARVSKVTTMTKVASIGASFLTDGTFLPDGNLLLRGYGRVYVVQPPAEVHDGQLSVLASASLPDQDQGESIEVTDGGRQALIGSEGRREPVLRIDVPVAAGDVPSATATLPSPQTFPPTPAASATPGSGLTSGPAETLRVWGAVVLAAILLAALTLVALRLLRGPVRRG